MAEPTVPIAELAPQQNIMTALEADLDDIDIDSALILADKNAAVASKNATVATAKKLSFGLMLGGA